MHWFEVFFDLLIEWLYFPRHYFRRIFFALATSAAIVALARVAGWEMGWLADAAICIALYIGFTIAERRGWV